MVVVAAFSSTADPVVKPKLARFYLHELGTPRWGSPTHCLGAGAVSQSATFLQFQPYSTQQSKSRMESKGCGSHRARVLTLGL